MISILVLSAMLLSPAPGSAKGVVQDGATAAQSESGTAQQAERLRLLLAPASSIVSPETRSGCAYMRTYIFSGGSDPQFERMVTCVPLSRPRTKRAQTPGQVHVQPVDSH